MTNDTERREIEDMLPWYAAGTLNRRDMKRVDDALAQDAELARRFALVRDELGETIRLNESLGAPSARAMEALFKKIDAEPARKPRSLGLGTRISEALASLSPRTLAWSAIGAAVAIILQAGLIADMTLNTKQLSGYQTASTTATATDGSYALVRFVPQASAADMTQFLETNKLTVVGGPIAGGMYRIRIASPALPKDEFARAVAKLRDNKIVDFIAMVE